MTNPIRTKTISFTLALVASAVFSFGAFVNIASAASLTPDILKGLNLDTLIAVSALPQIDPIPLCTTSPCTIGVHPDQAAAILTNIINDQAVQPAAQDVIKKQNACATTPGASADICNGTTTTTTSQSLLLGPVVTDLNTAIQKLGTALVNARSNQNNVINADQVYNMGNDQAVAVNNAINQSGATVGTNLGAQSNLDVAGTATGTTPVVGPSSDVLASQQNARNTARDYIASTEENKTLTNLQQSCSILSTSPNLIPCYAIFIYKAVYIPTSYVLMGSGYIFDQMLSLSISNKDMIVPGFINDVWKVVRDFSNMLFIFILIYTGIMTMFGQGDWAKTVKNVIIVALLINFSLFFTQVVIDAGNVLAVGIMSAIQGGGSLSEGLAKSFQPQQFLTAAAIGGASDTSGGNAIIVFLVATVVSGFAAYIFFKAALLFVRRLVVFWALMMLSPFAFISIAFPNGSKFDKWIETLIHQAFVAPIFLFFMYVIMIAIQAGGGIMSHIPTSSSVGWFNSLIAPVIIAAILIKAMTEILNFTEEYAGSAGSQVSSLVTGAMGLATGGATTLAALGGRAIGGRMAQGLADSGTLARVATGKSILGDNALARFAGRQAITLNETARTGTWDVRGANGFIGKNLNKAIGATGVDIGKVSAEAKGGFEGAQKRQFDADIAMAKKLKVTDEEKEAILGVEKDAANAADKSKKNADTAVTEAQEAYNNSATAKEIKASKEELTKATENAKSAQDSIAKAQKAYDEGFTDSGSAVDTALKQALDDAKAAGKPQIDALNAAEARLEKAVSDDSTSQTAQALKATITSAEETAKTAGDTLKTATAKLKEKEKLVVEENARRRGSYADYVEGRAQVIGGLASTVAGVAGGAIGGITAGPLGAAAGYTTGVTLGIGTYSTKQAQASAKKIRSTSVEKEEEEENEDKKLKKLAKELAKKNEEKESKEEKPAAKPAADAGHH